MWLLLTWIVVLVTALVLHFRQKYSFFSRRGVKTDRVIPPFGTMMSMVLRREHFVESVARNYKMFPDERFMGSYEFTNPVLLVKDVELIKRITVKDFEHFLDHRVPIDPEVDPLFGSTLVAMKGQEWKDMRSTLSPAFTSSKMKHMVPFMVEVGDQMVLYLKHKVEESGTSYIDVELKDLTTRFAHDVIASCEFGLKVDSLSERDNEFYKQGLAATTFSFKQIVMFLLLVAIPKIVKKFKVSPFPASSGQFFRSMVTETMRDREQRNVYRPDILHLLMEAKKGKLKHDEKTNDPDVGFATVQESAIGKKQTKRVWSDDELTAQAIVFFLAGFDTVSIVTSFLLYELAINPEVQDKLAQEIRETDAKNKGKIDFTSIQQMTYMDMVVSEHLRLWPPAFVLDRLCIKDYNLGKPNDEATEDYIIRKGEGTQIPLFAIQRDPKNFPNPEKFDPERFSDENKHNIKPYTYMPFGLGPRNCIASRFALVEMKIMIYQLLLQLEVTPGPKTSIPLKLKKSQTFSLRLETPELRFKVRA